MSSRSRRSPPVVPVLPVEKFMAQILDAVDRNQVIIVCGETGCGKTTQVPKYISQACATNATNRRIICSQPRRIATKSVAERVAHELGEKVGGTVGYQMRYEHMISPETQIIFATR